MAEKSIGKVTLKNVRLSYAHLFKPSKSQENDAGEMVPGKYGAILIIDPDTEVGKENLKKLKKAKEDVMAEKWGAKPPKIPATRLCTKKYQPPEDEDGEADMDAAKPEYLGMYTVSARNPDQPVLVDNKKEGKKWVRLEDEKCGKLYSGCMANVIVRLWAQDNKHGVRVNASLELAQFYKHNDAFSSNTPVNPEDELDDDLVEGGDLDELDDYGDGDGSDDGDLV